MVFVWGMKAITDKPSCGERGMSASAVDIQLGNCHAEPLDLSKIWASAPMEDLERLPARYSNRGFEQ